jgi:hypothetical protein
MQWRPRAHCAPGLEFLAGSAEDGGGARLANRHIDACNLRVVEALEQDQLPTVIHYRNDHCRTALIVCRLRGRCELLRDLQAQHLLDWQLDTSLRCKRCQPHSKRRYYQS